MANTHPLEDLSAARPVTGLILVMIVISLVAILGLLWLSFAAIDLQARENLKERVEVAFDVEATFKEGLLQENTYWDEAHNNLIRFKSASWAKDNVGTYMTESYGIDLAWAVQSDLSPTFAFIDGKLSEVTSEEVQQSQIPSLLEGVMNMDFPFIASGYRNFRDTPYLVSAGMFLAERSSRPKGDGSFLLFAKKLDQAFLDYMSDTYQLPAMRAATAWARG